MTREPYPPLRPQAPARRRAQSTPWLMILGVAVLALLAGAVVAILLGERDGGVAASPSGSVEASPLPSGSSTPSASASGSAVGAETPAPTAGPLAVDTIAVTTVDRLSVRREPGTTAERLGSLTAGSENFVAEGPTEADGLSWYLVSTLGLPPNSGCAVQALETDPYNCPVWFGWVAGASEDGEPWLVTQALDCPAQPFNAQQLILARTDLQRLACLGGTPFTFRAWWPQIPDDAGLGGSCAAQDRPSGWLLCQNVNYNQVTINESEGFGGVGALISINPASGISMPERGMWVELRVHLDDPAAQGCADGAEEVYADPVPEQAILNCRALMVLEAVQAVAGP
ncbi:MAG: hypothetical protein ABI841_00425 [Chloroflexota bacterium]